MDKFAVDLEKVLDDFEFNEGREESSLPSVIKNFSSNTTQKRAKHPASVYRRPAFEPINLSDADFSAASISASDNYVKTKEDFAVSNNLTSLVKPTEYSSPKISDKKVDDIIPYEEKEINSDDVCSSSDREVNHSDGTPDLLDSNSLKPNSNSVYYTEDPNLSSQLPDITSVSNNTLITPALATPADEPQTSFDLIKPASQSASIDDELPPIVDVGLVLKESIIEIEIKPISFSSVGNEIPDSELEEYLQDLDGLAENTIDTSSSVIDEDTPLGFAHISNNDSEESQSLKICEETSVDRVSGTLAIEESLTCVPACEMLASSKKLENVDENSSKAAQSCDLETFVNKSPELPIRSVNNSNNETLQTMCENIEGAGQQASSISTLEIISTQITEYKSEETIGEVMVQDHDLEPESLVEREDDLKIEDSEGGVGQFPSTVDEHSLSFDEPKDNAVQSIQTALDETKPSRPSSLALEANTVVECDESPTPTNAIASNSCGTTSPMERLGKFPPFWVPDTESDYCMQCQNKFTVIRRRHHCRACGLVLCSKCCNLKAPLEYLDFAEARVCQPCFNVIYRVSLDDGRYNLGRQPNPNNPMEYCSTISPLQQAASTLNQPPPSVLVPTGVLKREGRAKSDVPKQVIFSDGIRPGGDLTELDGSSESRVLPRKGVRRLATPPGGNKTTLDTIVKKPLDPSTQSLIPSDTNLPPVVFCENGQLVFSDGIPKISVEPVKFAINYNLFVTLKKVKLDCCVNRLCWSICTDGLACVGQDEIAIILECLPDELSPPQDLFNLINLIYQEASKGTTVSEMCFTPATSNTLFGSKDHGGFLYIRPTFQCTTNLLLPAQPYLIAILVHRWETPWARLFPLRLVLRLGAEYRYYPCPLVSIRNRKPLYTDIGHTVMKVLADFRKFSYSLATVRGLFIHMEDRQTTILFPKNRYDQVVRALNNSDESVLAFGANLSLKADSHLVCIQGTKDENTYHTQAINIHNKPRRVTGASFVVFNGALKTAGLSGKSSIMEDGLMVHLPSDSMTALRTALRDMRDYAISCGPNDEETVYLHWTEDDTNFNVGVKSCIDERALDGAPSIRVHNGTDYQGNHRIIRWTEVFILQSDDNKKAADPLDISRVCESIARATCMALVPDLDSLAAANLSVLSIRATIHADRVGYEAGSCGVKLPSVYMKHLDEALIPVIHQAAVASQDSPAVLELIFRVMNHP